MMPTARRRTAFTLVEILIVVVILGILAAIVVPQFSDASSEARRNGVRTQLATIRAQIELYKAHHGGGLPDLITDWSALTGTSTFGGKSFGPYLQKSPINSVCGDATVTDGDGTTDATMPCGFVFDVSGGTGKIWATAADGRTLLPY